MGLSPIQSFMTLSSLAYDVEGIGLSIVAQGDPYNESSVRAALGLEAEPTLSIKNQAIGVVCYPGLPGRYAHR